MFRGRSVLSSLCQHEAMGWFEGSHDDQSWCKRITACIHIARVRRRALRCLTLSTGREKAQSNAVAGRGSFRKLTESSGIEDMWSQRPATVADEYMPPIPLSASCPIKSRSRTTIPSSWRLHQSPPLPSPGQALLCLLEWNLLPLQLMRGGEQHSGP